MYGVLLQFNKFTSFASIGSELRNFRDEGQFTFSV